MDEDPINDNVAGNKGSRDNKVYICDTLHLLLIHIQILFCDEYFGVDCVELSNII